jgi:hypothetical protein
VTPGAHKQLKGLGAVKTGNNLRDHMTDLELIFTMLGEAGATEIARKHDALGLTPNRHAARQGGTVAGNARRELEAKTGAPVLSKKNYLGLRGSAPGVEAPAQTTKDKARRKGNKA